VNNPKSEIRNSKLDNILAQAIPMPTQTRRMVLRSLIGATIYAGFPAIISAGEGCCSGCGYSANRCKKICRLVEEDRKITTACSAQHCGFLPQVSWLPRIPDRP